MLLLTFEVINISLKKSLEIKMNSIDCYEKILKTLKVLESVDYIELLENNLLELEENAQCTACKNFTLNDGERTENMTKITEKNVHEMNMSSKKKT